MRTVVAVLALLAGCGTPETPTPPQEDTADTAALELEDWQVTGHEGSVVLIQYESAAGDDPFGLATGVFAESLSGLRTPVQCYRYGTPCLPLELPTGADEAVIVEVLDAESAAFDVEFDWVGDTISLGGFSSEFYVDPETSLGLYTVRTGPQSNLIGQPIQAVVGGMWGASEVLDGDLVGSDVMNIIDPNPAGFLDLETVGDSISFTWRPGAYGAPYLEIRTPENSELVALEDDGSYVYDLSRLPELKDGDLVIYNLMRVTTGASTTSAANTLHFTSISSQRVFSAKGGARHCDDVLFNNPGAPSGTYLLRPNPSEQPQMVYCDMATDGGGWTLVSNSTTPVDDMAIDYFAELAGDTPSGINNGVWGGLRDTVGERADIRFVCESAGNQVDLSFYENDWYWEITNGPTDADSCINESNGSGQNGTPARKNNRTGATIAAGTQWTAGYIESEDSCSDTGDFTVDFNDRGMDSNQSDGTDWGEDDSSYKCGQSGVQAGKWQIFVRPTR